MPKEIPIMFCFDKNYVIPASVAFYSLLENADSKYNYIFYVLHSDISNEQQRKLKKTISSFKNAKIIFKNMNHRLEEEWQDFYKGDHFSKEVMYKLLTASLFPKYDFIIVSDVDVVFLKDISKSIYYIKDDENYYIAGVKPIGKVKNYLNVYKKEWSQDEIDILGEVCGGYLVMNLKKIRENNIETKFMNYLKENFQRLNQMEQDILNIVCHNHIKHLPLEYVACSYMWDYFLNNEDMITDCNYSFKQIKYAMDHPIQLHYATGIKPWKNVDCTKSDVWFSYIVKTPFIKEYLQNLPYKIVLPDERINEIINENCNKTKTVIPNIISRIFGKIKRVIKKLVHYVL